MPRRRRASKASAGVTKEGTTEQSRQSRQSRQEAKAGHRAAAYESAKSASQAKRRGDWARARRNVECWERKAGTNCGSGSRSPVAEAVLLLRRRYVTVRAAAIKIQESAERKTCQRPPEALAAVAGARPAAARCQLGPGGLGQHSMHRRAQASSSQQQLFPGQ